MVAAPELAELDPVQSVNEDLQGDEGQRDLGPDARQEWAEGADAEQASVAGDRLVVRMDLGTLEAGSHSSILPRCKQVGCVAPNLLPLPFVKTIQIRNVPDTVHATLRTRAAAAGVSLSDYALAELERIAKRPAVSDVLRRAESRAGGPAIEDIVAAVRAGRDRE